MSTNVKDAPAADPGERIYAIGDVHGNHDLLLDLLKRLEDHSNALPPAKSIHVILLGDIVDRGPSSADVIRFAFESDKRTGRVITLLGNHEELMLRALDGEQGLLRAWMRVGGIETLRSFGLEPPSPDEDPDRFIARANKAIPREWREWLRKRPLTARSGDYLFCHAGIRPGVALRRQSREDLLWIRDEFLHDDGDHGVMVVHGHSVSEEVEVRSNRIGIDTGAYCTGVLSALYVEGTKREVISTEREDPALATADRSEG